MRVVEEIIERALELNPGSVKETDSMLSVDGWDSLGHLKILSELDIEFHGQLAEIEELSQAKSVKDLKDLLRSKGLLAVDGGT